MYAGGGSVVAVPMTTSGMHPPQPVPGYQGYSPQLYAPQQYPSGTPQPYPPGTPQPYAPGTQHPYPPSAAQHHTPGAYPMQQYAPTTPNPPTAAISGPTQTGYWNPADQGGQATPATTYNSELPPPSYEQVTTSHKFWNQY